MTPTPETEIEKVIEEFDNQQIGYVGSSTDFDDDAIKAFLRTTCKRMWEMGRDFALEEILAKGYEDRYRAGFLSAIEEVHQYVLKMPDIRDKSIYKEVNAHHLVCWLQELKDKNN